MTCNEDVKTLEQKHVYIAPTTESSPALDLESIRNGGATLTSETSVIFCISIQTATDRDATFARTRQSLWDATPMTCNEDVKTRYDTCSS